jgi:hypothetical protein
VADQPSSRRHRRALVLAATCVGLAGVACTINPQPFPPDQSASEAPGPPAGGIGSSSGGGSSGSSDAARVPAKPELVTDADVSSRDGGADATPADAGSDAPSSD